MKEHPDFLLPMLRSSSIADAQNPDSRSFGSLVCGMHMFKKWLMHGCRGNGGDERSTRHADHG
eukprot:6984251-Alexandrium_andersonii.AAC.1